MEIHTTISFLFAQNSSADTMLLTTKSLYNWKSSGSSCNILQMFTPSLTYTQCHNHSDNNSMRIAKEPQLTGQLTLPAL